MEQSAWITVLQACIPIFVALVGIVPTIVSNRKKTQDSLKEMENKLSKDIEATKKEVATLQIGFDAHVAEEEEHRAKQARYRFLRFYDEMCEGMKHSESHFEDVLDDVDFYENYAEHHDNFKNSRGSAAMKYIRETYEKLKKTGGFLTHE